MTGKSKAKAMGTWVALLIFPLVLTTVLGQANIDYFCPADLDCLCATLNETTSLVQLVCRPQMMSSWVYPWTLIPTALTTWLTFECQLSLDGFLAGRDFQHLSGLTELRFESCQLPTIPDETFYGLKNLDTLVMEGIGAPDMNATFLDPIRNVERISMAANRFRHLPKYLFCGKHRLTNLNISSNFFSDFNSIGIDFYGDTTCLPALVVIDISNNYLGSKLPSLYKSIPNIGWFVAANTGITSLSSDVFHNLTGLKSVDLSHNHISGLPEGMFLSSPNLKYVIMESMYLRSISPTLFQNVGKLEAMNLNANHLTDVDMEYFGLSSLSNVIVIEVNRNRLTSLTPSMLQGYPNLVCLDVSNNSIKTISEATFNYTNDLQYLFLQHNSLQHVLDNAFHGLQNLLILDISQNDLRDFGDESLSMSPLVTQLNMSWNKLTQFPITIRHLYQLQNLDLSHNNILELPEPASMVPLENVLGMSMKNNSLTVITNTGFNWVPHLQVLNLAINKITSLHPASFAQNRDLQFLNLESNNIVSLQEFLIPLNRLAHLYMAHNDVTILSSESLPSSLEYIDISNNLLTDLQPNAFLHLDSLNVVNLGRNRLRSFPREALYVSSAPDLTPQMYIKGNWLNCTCEMSWLRTIQGSHSQYPRYPDIMDYHFVYCSPADLIPHHKSLTEIRDDQFVCDYQESCAQSQCHCGGQLQFPNVCETTCYKCPENCICYETADKYFSLVDCRNRNLTNVPTALDPDTTLIYFDGNKFSYILSYTFSNTGNLTKLYLNSSGISYIEQYAFENLFKLRELYLHSNELECILFDTFVGLGGVVVMSLSDNKLRDIANGTLSAMGYLTELDLSGNLFTSLPYDIIRNELGLKSIHLSGNPWACDCHVGPNLKGWVVANAKIVADHKEMLCHLPCDFYTRNYSDNVIIGYKLPSANNYSHGKTHTFRIRNKLYDKHGGIRLKLAQPQQLDACPPITEILHPTVALISETFNFCSAKPLELTMDSNKALQSALIAFGIVLLVVVTLTLIMFNSRELFKVWLYTHYGLRFHKPEEDAYRDYDAFVSYSSQDGEFVSKQLAPKLESGNAPYKLLLHHRDWIVGASITESIIESVESSKRIIVLLSENYVRSEWCQYEFKTAHHNVMKEHKNRIVVILLGDKLPKGMGTDLKLYTKTTTYLRHDDPLFWNKLRYTLPEPAVED